MEKKSIGTFLAALRKASGLTQEEVAQRLFVSNKTVSKWERDESSPDLSLIPVLAELFQVTCDEILRGERGEREQGNEEKARLKTEKQVQRILTHTVNRFKSMSLIAAALTVLGLVSHFTVAYTYFKPLVAFGLGVAFLVGSVVLEGLQLIRANAALQDGAAMGEGSLLPAAVTFLLRRIAFAVFTLNAWAAILIWPMVAAQGLDYVNSVLSFDNYLSQLPMLLSICAAATVAAAYYARRWLDIGKDEKSVMAVIGYKTGATRRMARMQGAFLLGIAVLLLTPPALFVLYGNNSTVVIILFYALLAAILAAAVITLIRMLLCSKDRLERLLILLLSVRNVLLSVRVLPAATSVIIYVSESGLRREVFFDNEGIQTAVFEMVLITMVYLGIKYFLVKKHKGDGKAQAVS